MLRSIRLRLLVLWATVLALTLVALSWGLALLFDRHAERVELAALNNRFDALATALEPAPGHPVLAERPGDPLFQRPLSGHYWQIELDGALLRSRSLWDYTLPLPEAAPEVGGQSVRDLPGPKGERLVVLDRSIRLGPSGTPIRIAVAADRAELTEARRAFLRDLWPYLLLLALALVAAAAAQVTLGLRPLSAIGARVAALTSGAERRIGSDLPTEVMPLAQEIDSLLDAREAEVDRARQRAGDLAHALKTPLQALIGEAGRLRQRGDAGAADGLEEVAMAMQRHVDRELTRARIAVGSHAATDPARAVQDVVSVLRRTARGPGIDWQIEAEPVKVRIDRADLTEALGALIENAAFHAEGLVRIAIGLRDGQVAITVRDDGPGADPAQLEAMRGRGVRLDSRSGGHGLGLAIADDIAEAAGGRLELRNATPGLEAMLILPRAGG